MRLTTKLPNRKLDAATDTDPREHESAQIIDLASRNAFPAVTQRKGKSDAMGLVAGIGIVAALGAVTLWGMSSARMAPAEGVGGQQAQTPVPVAPNTQTPVTAAVAPVQGAPVTPVADPAPQPVLAAMPGAAIGPVSNPYASPTIVYDAGGSPIGRVAIPESVLSGEAGETAAPSSDGSPSGEFASRIGGLGGAAVQAQAMVNPATTVTQGTLIPAILETAIDTNVPGFVRAVVSQDVRSFDGKNVLVPRSSRLIGQYQSGLQNGQKRAYVIWTRLIRPDGASVNLQSPAVGFDGTTGLQGKVSSNFFQRFGSAMLLSVVSGLSAIGSGGASVVLGGGSQAAAVAVQQDSQIGPTIRVRQGAPIRVFTARDLDFSQVAG